MVWRRIRAEGTEWEVRAVARGSGADGSAHAEQAELLEFRPLDGLRSARRLAVPTGALSSMTDEALKAAFQRSRPIGGDHYGRPGKPMGDAA